MPAQAPATADPSTSLSHGCVRCGAPIPLADAMCERCNPLGLRQPSASQAHGTALIGMSLAVLVLAVVARVLTVGIGPFTATVAAVESDPGGLRVTISVRNDGTTTSATSCVVDDAGARGIGPGTAVVQSPNVRPGEQVTFRATVTTLGREPHPLSVTCGG